MIKIKKIIILILNPKFYIFLASRVFPSLEFYNLLKNRKYKTIFDIGSHKGQFLNLVNTMYSNVTIYSFEPQKKIFDTFLINYLNNNNNNKIFLNNFALGNKNERKKMYISKKTDSSSLKEITVNQTDIFKGTNLNYTELINIKKIDLKSLNYIDKPILLKIDVQGFEFEVLEGLENNLDIIDEVLIEVSFIELYKNQILADKIHKFLISKNFKSYLQINDHYKNNNLVQCDRLYYK